VVYLRERR